MLTRWILCSLLSLASCAPLIQTGGSVSAAKLPPRAATNDAPLIVAMPAAQLIRAADSATVDATTRNDPRTTTGGWRLIILAALGGALAVVAAYFFFTSAKIGVHWP